MTTSSAKIAPGGETPRRLADSINRIVSGRLDVVGVVTLTPGASSTTVTASLVSAGSTPILTATTANAASALASLYISSVFNGGFTIVHANNGQTDRTFRFAWLG